MIITVLSLQNISLKQYIYSNRLTFTFNQTISFEQNSIITVKINNETQFQYQAPSAAQDLKSLTFSEQRINQTENQSLNIFQYSKKVGHNNVSNVTLTIQQPGQNEDIYSATTENYIYYASIPQMSIKLDGTSDTQVYQLKITFNKCDEFDLRQEDSTSYIMNINGYQFKLGSDYKYQQFEELKNNQSPFNYTFACSDIDYTSSECYTVMENLEKTLNQEQELTIERNNYYTLIEAQNVTFDSTATYPQFLLSLDKNAIIIIVVIIVAVILITILIIYCCIDYKKSAIKEPPIQLGQNGGFGKSDQLSLTIREARKKLYNGSVVQGFDIKDDINRMKEKRELKKSQQKSQEQQIHQQRSDTIV